MSTIDLLSPLSPAECVVQLRDQISSRRVVRGNVQDRSFSIEKRIGYRNSFQTQLRAELVEELGGTRIKCRTGMDPVVFGLFMVWLSGFSIGAITTSLNPAVLQALGGGIVLLAAGRLFSVGEAAYLLDFVCQSLNGRKVE